MYLPVIIDVTEYDVCGVGQYAASKSVPSRGERVEVRRGRARVAVRARRDRRGGRRP